MRKILVSIICMNILVFYFQWSVVHSAALDHKDKQIESAKSYLNEFLNLRGKGDYKKCESMLSPKFRKQFRDQSGHDFSHYFRYQGEELYSNATIVKIVPSSEKEISFSVSVEVAGPGYTAMADETFILIRGNGSWQIDLWEIKHHKPYK